MEVLKCYDPNETRKPKESERCPTCNQKIEKRFPINEIRRVIYVYKMAIGVPKEDKHWDKHRFPILMPTAKKLVDFMGSWELAADCVQDIVERIKEWNPEAEISLQKIYSSHADKWLRDWKEKEAKR